MGCAIRSVIYHKRKNLIKPMKREVIHRTQGTAPIIVITTPSGETVNNFTTKRRRRKPCCKKLNRIKNGITDAKTDLNNNSIKLSETRPVENNERTTFKVNFTERVISRVQRTFRFVFSRLLKRRITWSNET